MIARSSTDAARLPPPDFERLFKAVPGLYVVTLPDAPRFTVVAVSDAYAEATKTPREDVVGRPLLDVFPEGPRERHADGRRAVTDSLSRVIRNRQTDAMAVQRYDIRRPGGGHEGRWWSPVSSPVLGPDGEVKYIMVHVEDVTRLHEQSRELEQLRTQAFTRMGHELRAPLQRIVEETERSAGASETPVSTRGELLEIAESARTLLRYVDDLRRHADVGRAPTRAVRDGGVVLVVENDREMSTFICESLAPEFRVVPAYDGDDGLARALELHPDLIVSEVVMPRMRGDALLTELQRHDETATTPVVLVTSRADEALHLELLRAGAEDCLTKPFSVSELRSRVRNLLEKAQLRRRAARAIAARDEVLGIVAHDLRNPLNVILLQLRLMRRRGGEPERRSQRPVDAIRRAALRMNRLIQDMLDVASVEAGSFSIDRRAVAPLGLLTEACESQRDNAANNGIFLRLDRVEVLPDVFADPDRLLQVFENLIGNAIKFTPRGGDVVIGGAERANDVLFWVADTGSGIPKEHVERLFESFWQAEKSDRRGAGLGLPIVKAIVDAHGGRVWVDSQLDRGTTFYFTVPLASSRPSDRSRHVS